VRLEQWGESEMSKRVQIITTWLRDEVLELAMKRYKCETTGTYGIDTHTCYLCQHAELD